MIRFQRELGVFLLCVLFSTAISLAHEGHGQEVGQFDLDAPRKISPETAAHIGLKTAEVDFGSIQEILQLYGIVKAVPDRHWTISTRNAGKLLSIRVQVGDVVHKGDLLVEIDSPEYQKLVLDLVQTEGRIQQLEVETQNAEATAQLAESELQRSESAGEGVIPLTQLIEKRTTAIRARGEARLRSVDLEVARREAVILRGQVQAIRSSRDDFLTHSAEMNASSPSSTTNPEDHSNDLVIRLLAPADGVVVERNARIGHWATAGETLLAIADYSSIQIEGELPESLVARVTERSSDVVRIRNASKPKFFEEGKIKFISPVIDEIKRTAHVIIEAPNPTGYLREGMYVDLSLVLREAKDAVVVPTSAMVQDGPMHFVFIQDGEFYKKQDISPGITDDQNVEVLSGLAPGDVVVTQGAYSLTQLRPKPAIALATAPPQNQPLGEKKP